MTTLHQDIRGALQTQAGAVSGFPPAARRDYEANSTFTPPAPGTSWARLRVMTTSRRPLGLSLATGAKVNDGLFEIVLFWPPKKGTADVEAMADRLIAAFEVDAPLVKGVARVQIQRVERSPVMPTETDQQITVIVHWRCLTSS